MHTNQTIEMMSFSIPQLITQSKILFCLLCARLALNVLFYCPIYDSPYDFITFQLLGARWNWNTLGIECKVAISRGHDNSNNMTSIIRTVIAIKR